VWSVLPALPLSLCRSVSSALSLSTLPAFAHPPLPGSGSPQKEQGNKRVKRVDAVCSIEYYAQLLLGWSFLLALPSNLHCSRLFDALGHSLALPSLRRFPPPHPASTQILCRCTLRHALQTTLQTPNPCLTFPHRPLRPSPHPIPVVCLHTTASLFFSVVSTLFRARVHTLAESLLSALAMAT
jgi:hypothetical protein